MIIFWLLHVSKNILRVFPISSRLFAQIFRIWLSNMKHFSFPCLFLSGIICVPEIYFVICMLCFLCIFILNRELRIRTRIFDTLWSKLFDFFLNDKLFFFYCKRNHETPSYALRVCSLCFSSVFLYLSCLFCVKLEIHIFEHTRPEKHHFFEASY